MEHSILGSKIDSNRPVVALTFDDGPGLVTSHILDLIQVYGGKVSFFVLGKYVEMNRTKIHRAWGMGCDILCHSWEHVNHTEISKKAVSKQIIDTCTAIASVTGEFLPLYRPPYGEANKNLAKLTEKLGLSMVNWSLDPKDYDTSDATAISSFILDNVVDGDVVLCHDVYDSTGDAMGIVIPSLVSRGFQLITVSELLYRRYGTLEPGVLYNN
ncbi:MAG: polysaccharide deacetylase family protein [Oscillospiraceae bacterium]|nr:polysaccharide deacetylase family protein [Oscillospiraceae bacterium]